MAFILCSTRGGEASYPNQDRAIAIAGERGLDVLFLYVSNVRFLDQMASPVLIDIEKELDRMGEFLLVMAQERAEKGGVKAETACRHGAFHEALQSVIEEHDVAAVVLGSPSGETGVTTPQYLQDLTRWILDEIGVEVFIVYGGEIVDHYVTVKGDSKTAEE